MLLFPKTILLKIAVQETDFHKHISQPIDTLVFLELSPNTFHWTCWEYRVSSIDSIVCRGINSSSTTSYLEAVDRIHHFSIVAAYLRLKSHNVLEVSSLCHSRTSINATSAYSPYRI